jgi:hypothetical protein
MVVLPELSSPMMMIFSYFFPVRREKILPKKPPIEIQDYYYPHQNNKSNDEYSEQHKAKSIL